MKKLVMVGCAVLSAMSVWGQGSLHFGNTPTTLITTNDFQSQIGNIVGPGNYGFGLYIGPFGSSGDSLILTALATNGVLAGRFEGGNLTLLSPGMQYSFQVRGWSSFAGASYEQAYNAAFTGAQPDALLGQSTLGFFAAPTSGTIELFGTGPGQVGGFPLTPLVVPEPSAYALAAIGLCLLFLVRPGRRLRSGLTDAARDRRCC